MTKGAAVLVAFAIAANAQVRISLTGTVRDVSGAAIPRTTVTAWNEENGLRRSTLTGLDGGYRIDSLPVGIYKVAVRRLGFRTQIRLDFPIETTGAALDFILQIGSVHEVVTIRGAPLALNTLDATVSVPFEHRPTEALPLNAGGVLNFVELAPGIVTTPATQGEAGQFSVSGQRPNANFVEVNGVTVNSGVSGSGLPGQFSGGTLPMMTAFGSSHSLASLDEIEEMRAETSSFAPEYGRMPGGHISFATRSGTEQLHGSLNASFRNAVLEANDWLANSAGLGHPASRLADWSAMIGGPLAPNRTFFFANYEALRLEEPYTWNMVAPPLNARSQASSSLQELLAAFPVPNGGSNLSSAVYTRPATLDSGTLRLDHALASNISTFVRIRESPSSADSGYAQVDHARFSAGDLTLGVAAFPKVSVVNDARLHASRVGATSQWIFTGAGGARPVDLAAAFNYPLGVGNQDAALYGFGIGGIGTIHAGTPSPTRQGQLEIDDTLSWTAGSHTLKAGINYERLTPSRESASTGVAGTFSSLTEAFSGKPVAIGISRADQASSLIETLAAFAQDTWRLSRNLTVTYGVRWELTPAPALRAGAFLFNPPAEVPFDGGTKAGTNGGGSAPGGVGNSSSPVEGVRVSPLWPTRFTQFEPRVGLAYRISPDTALRAGLGLFYDATFSVATDPVNGFPYNRWQFSATSLGGPSAPVVTSLPLAVAYAPELRLPYVEEWNFSLERLFPQVGTAGVSYVGSHGVRNLRREAGSLPGSTFADSLVSTNDGFSHYHALELQYRRSFPTGLSSTLAYTWSHSIDNGSWDNAVFYTQGPWTAASDRASSSFDVRQNFTASLEWDKRGWKLAAITRARSGFPIDVLTSENLLGLGFDNATRPDRVAGAPLWIADTNVAGGRRLNPAAFAVPVGALQGTLGRNAIAGFSFYQVDLGVSHEFPLRDRWRLDLRVDAYNAFNHPIPGDPTRYLDSPLFGISNSSLNAQLGMGTPHSGLAPSLQMGSPRTLQFSARVSF